MDKNQEKKDLLNHNIKIVERQTIEVSGVIKIDSFDNEEFLLETTVGPLGIKGRDLEIIKLDTYEGTIMIKGIVDAFSYFDTKQNKNDTSVIARLFK